MRLITSEAAIPVYLDAGHCFLSEGDTVASLGAYRSASSAYTEQEQYQQALTTLEPLAQQLDAAPAQPLAWLYVHLGYHAISSHQVLRSRDHYQRAADLFHVAGVENFSVASYCYRQLGNIYTRLGDLEKATHLLERFLVLAREHGQPKDVIDAVGDLSIAFLELGDTAKAQAAIESALANAELAPGYRGDLLLHLSSCYASSQPERAIMHAREALALFQQPAARSDIPYPGYDLLREAVALRRTGLLLIAQQPEHGFDTLRSSIKLLQQLHPNGLGRDLGKGWIELGTAYANTGLHDSALVCAHRALHTVLPLYSNSDVKTAPSDTWLYAENTIMDALILKAQSMKQLHRQQKDDGWLQPAFDHLQAAAMVETQLKNLYRFESSKLWLQEQGDVRMGLAMDVMWELYQLDPAQWQEAVIALFEGSRANVLAMGISQPIQLLPEALQLEQHRLFLALQDARRALATVGASDTAAAKAALLATMEYERFAGKITQAMPQQAQWQQLANAVQLAQARNWLQSSQHDWLLEYYQGPVNTWVLAISPDSFIFKPLVHTARLLPMVQTWLPSVNDRNYIFNNSAEADAAFTEGARSLGRVLINNVLGELDEPLRIAISPDGWLARVPFDVLLPGAEAIPGPVDYRTLPYLCTQAQIHYLPSVRIVQLLGDSTTRNSLRFAAFAADYSSTDLPQLPAAKSEAQQLAQRFEGTAWLDAAATKARFASVASTADILHLSLHGIQNRQNSEWSYLAFTPTDSSDGKLYIPELYAQPMTARLAVLDACNTAAGDLYAGEGVMSLSRAFAYAGCESVVMSLWPVADAASGPLINQFYDGLLDGKPIAEAMQQARLHYVQNTNDPIKAHPVFWAGLVSSGSNAVLVPPSNSVSLWWLLLIAPLLLFVLWRTKHFLWQRPT